MGIDIRSVAFARLVLGTLLIATFINFALYAPILMSDYGVLPREMSLNATGGTRFSLFLANGSTFYQWLLLSIGTAAAGLFACNISPRATLLVCWIIFYSLYIRCGDYTFGLCPAMLGVLFWALWVPWNRVPTWPVISLKETAVTDRKITHWALWGMFLICAAISCGAGIIKFKNFDAWFVNYEALSLDFSYYTNVNPVTRTLLKVPYLLQIASPVVVFVEIAAPILLLTPFARRFFLPTTLVLATIVYVGIAISIHVGIFPLIPLVGFYLMISGDFWERCTRYRLYGQALRLTASIKGLIKTLKAVFSKIIRLSVCGIGTALVVCFTLKAIHDQTGHWVPNKLIRAADFVSAPVFNLFEVRSNWSWIYGGGMRNRFLIVRSKTENELHYTNMTSVNYRGVLYNYLMNYANSILDGKDDTRRLFNYTRYLCSHDLNSRELIAPAQKIDSIELFDISDSANEMTPEILRDKSQLQRITTTKEPFFTYDCKVGRSSWIIDDNAGDYRLKIKPGSATELPLIGWSQDFGVLRINRAVDGAPISIHGKIYSHGFGTHANSRIRLATQGLRSFSVDVGIDDERKTSRHSSVQVRIEGDGRELYRSPIMAADTAAQHVNIDITGVSELVLIADDAGSGQGNNKNYDDHVSWGDPIVR
jgi:hypothetical protein